ncbi:unnamed protein product [Ilex paraguariensis]|uniref:Uncharacterized protein n=1 Tax=Ilex paraguariensis TaxID=185542 RepID=A0ABC8TNF1_9AQUA
MRRKGNNGSPNERDMPLDKGNRSKGNWAIEKGPSLDNGVVGALEVSSNQQVSESDRMEHWAIEDFMDSLIAFLAQPKQLPKLGDTEGLDEITYTRELIGTKKWRRKEKGTIPPVQTSSQVNLYGKRNQSEGNEDRTSSLGGDSKKKVRLSSESRDLALVEMEEVMLGSGL